MAAISVQTIDANTLCVHLTGRLDLRGTDELETPFAAHTASHRAMVVVDLSGVEFLSSIGIRLFLSNAKAQQRRGGRMVLAAPTAMVDETLRVAGIDKLLPIYASCDEAIEALRSSA